MKKNKLIAIAIATSLLLGGCPTSKIESFTCAPTETNSESPTSDNIADSVTQVNASENIPNTITQPTRSEDLKISIHVDGSGSMVGYVENSESRYIRTLQIIRSVFTTATAKNSKVKYYRSGDREGVDSVNQEIEPDQLPQAENKIFYANNDNFPGVSSALAKVIIPKYQEEEELLVMVTDLVPNQGEVTAINQVIKNDYLTKPGYAAAIVGIKSEFNDKVYVPIAQGEQRDFFYNNERPFYVMLLGPYQEISYFLDKLNFSEQFTGKTETIIFAPDKLIENPVYLDKQVNNPDNNKLNYRENSLDNGQSRVEVRDSHSQLWEITNNEQKIEIKDEVKIELSKYSLDIDNNNLKANIAEIKAFNLLSREFEQANGVDLSQLESALNLHSWEIDPDNQQLSFINTINPKQFPESGIYLFTFDIVVQEPQLPEWVKEWSQDFGSRDDGSKTQNLLMLLEGLKNTTITSSQGNSNVIGRFCYAFSLK